MDIIQFGGRLTPKKGERYCLVITEYGSAPQYYIWGHSIFGPWLLHHAVLSNDQLLPNEEQLPQYEVAVRAERAIKNGGSATLFEKAESGMKFRPSDFVPYLH